MHICFHCRWYVDTFAGARCNVGGEETFDPVTGQRKIIRSQECYEKNKGKCEDYSPKFPWNIIK